MFWCQPSVRTQVVFLLFLLSLCSPVTYSVGFTFFCVLKHICKRTWNSALYECTTDWQHPFQFCCSKLIIENVFWIIYGNNSIVMLAHTDPKHKKNLSNAKEINWFWISHIFCIATDLHTSNCRFQMSESIRLPTGSPDCFQQNSFVCTYTQLCNFLMLKYSPTWKIPAQTLHICYFSRYLVRHLHTVLILSSRSWWQDGHHWRTSSLLMLIILTQLDFQIIF